MKTLSKVEITKFTFLVETETDSKQVNISVEAEKVIVEDPSTENYIKLDRDCAYATPSLVSNAVSALIPGVLRKELNSIVIATNDYIRK